MKWLLALTFLWLASCGSSMYMISTDNDKIPVNAQLTDVYSTFDKCGHKGKYSCEVFKGRYWLPDQQLVLDKDIDGFTFKHFNEAVSNNGVASKADVQVMDVYRSTLEGRVSGWWWILGMFGAVCGTIVILYPVFEDLDKL